MWSDEAEACSYPRLQSAHARSGQAGSVRQLLQLPPQECQVVEKDLLLDARGRCHQLVHHLQEVGNITRTATNDTQGVPASADRPSVSPTA